jgi:hypothetical protein
MARRILPHAPAALLETTVLTAGEIAYDETNKTIRVGDGSTYGGAFIGANGIVLSLKAIVGTQALNTAVATAAVNVAIQKVQAVGAGDILFDIPEIKLGKIVVPEVNGGARNVRFIGSPWTSKVTVGAACDTLFDLQAAQVTIEGLLFTDPGNLVSESYIRCSVVASNFPIKIRKCIAGANYGTTTDFVRNIGSYNVTVEDFWVQNMGCVYNNVSGGVNNVVRNGFSLGTKYGIILDCTVTPAVAQAEGFTARDLFLHCTQPNSRAVLIRGNLATHLYNVQGLQLGSGGIGLEIATTAAGKAGALIRTLDCYWECSDTQPAVRIVGNVSDMLCVGDTYGTGGYPFGTSRGVVIDGRVASNVSIQRIKFVGCTSFNTQNVAFFAHTCSGLVVDSSCDFTSTSGNQLTNCLNSSWECGSPPIASDGLTAIDAWYPYVPTRSSSGGTIGTNTLVQAFFKRTKTEGFVEIVCDFSTIGTATGLLKFSLPANMNAQPLSMRFSGAEPVVNGGAVYGIASGPTLECRLFNGNYPGQAGARILLGGSYRLA